jgi:hypothetical protein
VWEFGSKSLKMWLCHTLMYVSQQFLSQNCHQSSAEYLKSECFTSIEYTHGKRIFVGANICFKILAANASIDFSPRRILEYSSEAIRPIYARSGPYAELRTSNLSSLGCILSYIIEYYALQWCILLLYVANIVYLRPTEMVEAQILARYSRTSSIYTRSSANIHGILASVT